MIQTAHFPIQGYAACACGAQPIESPCHPDEVRAALEVNGCVQCHQRFTFIDNPRDVLAWKVAV